MFRDCLDIERRTIVAVFYRLGGVTITAVTGTNRVPADVIEVILAATDPCDPNVRQIWNDPNNLYRYGHSIIQAHYIADYALWDVAEAENLTESIKDHYAYDVAITDAWPSVPQIAIGHKVGINVEVRNCGTRSATFDVNVYADSNSLVGTQTVTLVPKSKNTLIFYWDTNIPDVNVGYYRITAKAEILEGENFTADNTYTGRTIKVWDPYDTNSPTAPYNLHSTGETHNTVSLAWNHMQDYDLAGYKVYRDESLVGYAADMHYTDTGLDPNTDYVYTVSAYDLAGRESNLSDQFPITTP